MPIQFASLRHHKNAIGICVIVSLVALYYSLFHRTTQPNNGGAIDPYAPVIVNGKLSQYGHSRLAHRLLDGLRGIEIGAAAHNPYGLDTLNVDYTERMDDFRLHQMNLTNRTAKVHILASGNRLPFTNDSVDFVISSHVIEHFYDPIGTIQEWLRVVRPGGYVYMDIPHKERTFDRIRERTTLAELLERHHNPNATAAHNNYGHNTVWVPEDVLALCRHFGWHVAEWRNWDDKTGVPTAIGFTVVLQKDGPTTNATSFRGCCLDAADNDED